MQVREFKKTILEPMSKEKVCELLGADDAGSDLLEVLNKRIDEIVITHRYGDISIIAPIPPTIEFFAPCWNPAYQIATNLGVPFTGEFSKDGERFIASFVMKDVLPGYDITITSTNIKATVEEELML